MIDPWNFQEIKDFAESLKGCFQARLETSVDEKEKNTLYYVLKVINIHLDLKELECEKAVFDHAKACGEER